MRILFMGTPDFALFSLRALCEEDGQDTVVGVLTQPDKPKGRGYALTPPPVKVYAERRGIPVYQPQTLRDGAIEDILHKLDPELIIVVAYGKILPRYVLEYPKHGCINIHASLLPRYRGAAPMQRAIMEGETVSGVTSMYMAEGLDTGDMLFCEKAEILPDDDFEAVHDKLGAAGGRVLLRTLDALRRGALHPIKQDDALATYAHKIEKEECRLDFAQDARRLSNKIRALSPFPLAYTTFANGKKLKIVRAAAEAGNFDAAPGTVVCADRGGVRVACGSGCLCLTRFRPEGKGEQSAADLLNGRQIAVGDILGREV